MKLLLAGGDMDVNSRNLEGATALTYAAGWAGNAEIMKLLFEQDGIDVNPVDSSGATPLDHAEREVAKFLLEQDPVYSRAATPLDHLDREQRESIVQLLREAGGRTGEELQAEARASH
ncbi:hypothetical protein BD779DRAFT_1531404 [Infundibulicybe gibba]|nr:hypothetical protein BD779DRAFT_1531404 [Infundibulicybe gibba]